MPLLLSLVMLPLVMLTGCGDKDGGDTSGGTADGGTADGGTADGGTADGGTGDGGTGDGGGDGGTGDGGTGDGGTGDGGTGDGGTGDGGTGAADCSLGTGWEVGPDYIGSGDTDAWRYVPKGLPACAPVVVFGHGGSAAGNTRDDIWEDPLRTGLVELAESRGFVLIVPGVTATSGSHSWSLDATGDLHGLVAAATDGVDIDQDRIWFLGQSAGCHMAVYTGLYDSGPFDGIGAVSGGIGRYFDYPETAPSPLLPFYVAHDPADSIVDYSYSEDLAAELSTHGHDFVFEDWEMGSNGHNWADGLTVAILDWLAGL